MKYLSLLLLLIFSSAAFGQINHVPASPYPVTVVQSDGSLLNVYGAGDERFHYSVTEDRYTILLNEAGDYEYAERKKSGGLVSSGVMARNIQDRSYGEELFLRRIDRELVPFVSRVEVKRSSSAPEIYFPSTGVRRTLMLLIQYPDKLANYDINDFGDMMNQPGYKGTGSFRDYYLVNSDGELDLNTDVYGWFTASHELEYYGRKNGDERAHELVEEVIDAAAAAGVDFSLYDNDGDGILDNLIVVHSGPGAEEGGNSKYIWSHSWQLSQPKYYNDVFIDRYIIQPETRTYGMVGIGVFCHEFGHALGLPDLYDTDYTSHGLGNWCLMSLGLWLNYERTPALMSAWCREKLGWVIPVEIPWPVPESSYGDYHLQPAATSTDVMKFLTSNPNEYFLLENKYQTGFDAALPGSGMAIFHVNTDATDNNDESMKLVALVEADGLNDLDRKKNKGDAGDLFPGSTENTLFNDYTKPSSTLHDGTATGIHIQNIALEGSVVSFSIDESNYTPSNLTFDPDYNSLTVHNGEITVQARIINNGNMVAERFNVSFYVSQELPVTRDDVRLGVYPFVKLNIGAYSDIQFSADLSRIPSLPTGNYYVGFYIDPNDQVDESDKDDNWFNFAEPTVTHEKLPNLAFFPLYSDLNMDGSTVTIQYQVINSGNATSAESVIGYYLSFDQEIDAAEDFFLLSTPVGILNAGEREYIYTSFDIYDIFPDLPPAVFYIGCIVNFDESIIEESYSDNSFVFTYPIFNNCQVEEVFLVEEICEGSSYQIGDFLFDESGSYSVALTNQFGCDSVVALNLTVLPVNETTLTEDICQGTTYQVGGEFFNESGTYSVTLTNRFGCDSVVTLHLTVLPVNETTLTEEICLGTTYQVGDESFNESGTYRVTLTNRFGCDSVVTLNLTVLPVSEITLTEEICLGTTYQVGDESFNESGTYSVILTNRFGCDSVVTLNLTVLPVSEITLTEEICLGTIYRVGDESFYESGIYTITLTNQFGCDSVVTLNLTVLPVNEITLTEEIYLGTIYQVGDELFDESGTYTVTLTNRFGCDSVITLDLTVKDPVSVQDLMSSDLVVLIYPNPAKDHIFIKFSRDPSEYTIKFISIEGRVIHQKHNFHSVDGLTDLIGVELLPDGLYYLLIESKKEYFKKRVLIKK